MLTAEQRDLLGLALECAHCGQPLGTVRAVVAGGPPRCYHARCAVALARLLLVGAALGWQRAEHHVAPGDQ